jgi:hypothetical protein
VIYHTESEARQHIEQLFEVEEMQLPDGSLSGLAAKYNGERLLGLCKPNYDRLAHKQINPTDTDATPCVHPVEGVQCWVIAIITSWMWANLAFQAVFVAKEGRIHPFLA